MLNKENVLFGIVGLLLGLIVGFMFANSVNQGTISGTATRQNANLPAGHPDLAGSDPTGRQTGSIPEVQAAIETARNQPDNFEAQIKAAELFYQIQRFEGALEFLQRAKELKPDDYGVTVQLGNANFDAGRYSEAEKWYTEALKKKDDDVNVRTDLGLTFVFRDPPDYKRGIEEFKRALETDPNHVQTMQNLIVAYSKNGDSANANSVLAQLEKIDPSNSAIPKLREQMQSGGR